MSLITFLFPKKLKTFFKKFRKFNALNQLDKKMLEFINYEDGFFIECGANDGVDQSNTWYFEKNLNENGFANTGIKDRGFMDSIYFREPLGLLIELASYKFDPPIGFTHANVLEKAHELRVKRKALNIQDQDVASAIKELRNK